MKQRSRAKYGSKLTVLLMISLLLIVSFITYNFFRPKIDPFVSLAWKNLTWKPQKLTFKSINPVEEIFAGSLAIPDKLEYLKSSKWDSLECVETENSGVSFSAKDIRAQIKDRSLLEALEKIKSREYKDEVDVYTEKDGKRIKISQDKRSKKNIMYESLCRTSATYYIIFTTTDVDFSFNPFVKTAFAGGGDYWGPQNLAIVSAKETKIIEQIGIPRPMAYWSCREIIGISGRTLILGCSGEGAGSLNTLDIDTQKSVELFYCQSRREVEGEKTTCYDAEGKKYFEKTYVYRK